MAEDKNNLMILTEGLTNGTKEVGVEQVKIKYLIVGRNKELEYNKLVAKLNTIKSSFLVL